MRPGVNASDTLTPVSAPTGTDYAAAARRHYADADSTRVDHHLSEAKKLIALYERARSDGVLS